MSNEVKLGSPQLFCVSIADYKRGRLHTNMNQAATWQEAVHNCAVLDFLPWAMEVPKENTEQFPTITVMKQYLFREHKVLLSVSLVRPSVEAITTGYELSDSGPVGPLSSTVVRVAVEHMKLQDKQVYVP